MPTLNLFLNNLINTTFKLLPLYEDNLFFGDYVDSVYIETVGALDTFEILKSNQYYVSIINTLNYFRKNNLTHKQCKREVLKMIDNIEKLKKQIGGDNIG